MGFRVRPPDLEISSEKRIGESQAPSLRDREPVRLQLGRAIGITFGKVSELPAPVALKNELKFRRRGTAICPISAWPESEVSGISPDQHHSPCSVRSVATHSPQALPHVLRAVP